MKRLLPLISVLACGMVAVPAQSLRAQQGNKGDKIVKKDTVAPNSAKSFNLLYHKREEKLSLESISEVQTPALQKTIAANWGTMVTGRLAGLYTNQSSGNPGYDDVALYLRGRTPLVLIDGTPQSFSSINPEQIESITVLKDALATAMLGIRSANGAILITTQKGVPSKANFSFNAQYGVQRPMSMPKFLNAYDYATLYNEARVNDGNSPAYSPADLDAFRNGTDSIGHPDVDWQDKVLKQQSKFSRYDMAVSGGGAGFRYFVNLDYLHQEGMFKNDDSRVYNSNADYKRYIVRSNLDLDISKSLTATVNMFGRVQNYNQPGSTSESILTAIRATPNSAYPALNRDGSLGGNLNFQNNIYGQVYQSGYRPSNAKDFKVDGSLKLKLDNITTGLWARSLVALTSFTQEDINRSRTFAVYQDMGANVPYKQFNTIGDQTNTSAISSQNRLYYSEVSLGYNREIGRSKWDALVVANNDNRTYNSDLTILYPGLSGNVSYSLDQKYIVQAAASYSGSTHYAKGNRNGMFPAIGFGWVLSKESFLQRVGWLSLLKLRASYGISGYDPAGYYDYIQYYNDGTGYNFGNTPTAVNGLSQDALVNSGKTWEKAKKLNIGFDAAFFNNHLQLSADYFNNEHYDQLLTRGKSTAILGAGYPNENLGRSRYSGYELQLNYQNHAGAISYGVSANAAVLKTKVLFQDEPARTYAYMRQTGQPVGQLFGYVADGLFQSQHDADVAAKPFNTVRPGDIKYKDLNNDGLINGLDQTAIGNTKPQLTYGMDLSLGWKGFDLSCLIQGVANRNIVTTGSNFWEFQNNGRGQAYENNLKRWTPETATTATYPRVSVGTNANNSQLSSFWVCSGNYLRMKSVELGYTVPMKISERIKLNEVRFYINGYNLLTASPFKLADPEGYNANYPLQKMVNAGLNIKF
ncbi:SusC/RagA family TonB-linked outer membrane protein [Pinibacter soli]|uniref:SusC/RagA family TonB-linked outer membrane protein n=1 Tax=Pinibacter soli TaxID=3044211 RepID=A0ABT6R7G6_9BACT|nr:SusC/RagA family TonB-linked outer membrane protein [Pinibacter soli]MDI3318381.1 SusC/RagA family TonB-linked outer membrane protein [Pinibacter soli]